MTDEQIEQALVEKLCKEKAEKNNAIDLNAYAIGLQDMFIELSQPNPVIEKLKELREKIQDEIDLRDKGIISYKLEDGKFRTPKHRFITELNKIINETES